MVKRSGKFYRKNEKEVMEALGLEQTLNSGSGWIEKEDGQSEQVIAQLKSTDAQSIKVELKDIHTLEYNAEVVHKLPVFVVQFLTTDETFLLMRPELLEELAQYLQTGKVVDNRLFTIEDVPDMRPGSNPGRRTIKSSDRARDDVREELSSKYQKKRRSAK